MEVGSSQNSVLIHPVDLNNVVRRCTKDRLGGRIVSTAHAVEELRIETGDFTSSENDLANAISREAISLGCAVLFDEAPGAGMKSV